MGLKDEAIGSSQESAIGSQESEVVDPTPPEEWMVEQRLAAKRAEEKMAAGCDAELIVAKRPRAARQLAVEEAEAAEEIKSVAKPAVPGGKKTKLVKVRQEYIDALLKRYPKKPLVPIPDEIVQKMYPNGRDQLLAAMAEAAATLKACRDKEEAILEQYHTKGYAYEEIEIRDDAEDVEALMQ